MLCLVIDVDVIAHYAFSVEWRELPVKTDVWIYSYYYY